MSNAIQEVRSFIRNTQMGMDDVYRLLDEAEDTISDNTGSVIQIDSGVAELEGHSVVAMNSEPENYQKVWIPRISIVQGKAVAGAGAFRYLSKLDSAGEMWRGGILFSTKEEAIEACEGILALMSRIQQL